MEGRERRRNKKREKNCECREKIRKDENEEPNTKKREIRK